MTIDPTILSSAIGAGGAILSAGLGAAATYYANKKKWVKKQEELEKSQIGASQEIKDSFIDSFGYVIGSLSVKLRMLNLQGDFELTRSYQGVKIQKKGITITNIPGRAHVNAPNCKLLSLPKFSQKPTLKHKLVRIKHYRETETDCQFHIEIPEGLTEDDPAFDFAYQYTCESGLCVTSEQMERAFRDEPFKREYSGAEILKPIKKLRLECEFPEGYDVQSYPLVFYVDSEVKCDSELNRIKNTFTNNENNPIIEISEPKIGFCYGISWVPPKESIVNRLKEMKNVQQD